MSGRKKDEYYKDYQPPKSNRTKVAGFDGDEDWENAQKVAEAGTAKDVGADPNRGASIGHQGGAE